MKNLNSFTSFDFKGFFADKKLMVKSSSFDENNNILRVEVIIAQDNTKYDNNKNNLFESFTVKILSGKNGDEARYIQGKPCKLQNITKCSVWGEYRDKLSVEGELIVE